MRIRSLALVIAALTLCSGLLLAKDRAKDQATLPHWILQAHTVSVLIDPSAGTSPEDAHVNQIARADVETALRKWGRFEPSRPDRRSDLIIVIRRSSRRPLDAAITDPQQNSRPGALSPIDDGTTAAGRRSTSSPASSPQHLPGRSPQFEADSPDDSFVVYDGRTDHPLDSSPAWRYVAPDALRPHSVPAVAEFRKAVAAAEKAADKP